MRVRCHAPRSTGRRGAEGTGDRPAWPRQQAPVRVEGHSKYLSGQRPSKAAGVRCLAAGAHL
jgi:hypothetical protein